MVPLEMWGGIECSYVRIGDRRSDQLQLSGHDERLSDLDRIAALGVRTLRYPISWERMLAGRMDWAWVETRLNRIQALGMSPIVGFVHHGSGPIGAGLADAEFAPRLAEFAHEFASRFPWVGAYTPVNEPGTTARFSGLYGLWHPHGHDAACFIQCLVHQVDAIGQSMRAIRRINPAAKLIQTEDIGKAHAAPGLKYQADFENERRWLSLDLLCGQVDERHPLWGYIRDAGVTEAQLHTLRDHRCPPDVIGMNHYVTSERFLDDRLHLYPAAMHGGNGRQVYVDLPAVRVRQEELLGPAGLLRELWQRFRLPIAITEVQLACTREEQLRWLMEVWEAAKEVRAEGIEIQAVTAWALLGAHDWDSLLTAERGSYESGAFDLRAPSPRPTAVAGAIAALAKTGSFEHPTLASPGWWRRTRRLTQPPLSAASTGVGRPWAIRDAPPLLIVGAGGPLASALVAACQERGLAAEVATHPWGEPMDSMVIAKLLACRRPWAVIHCGAGLSLAQAESDPSACRRAAVLLPGLMAEACVEHRVKFLTFTNDLVFDGTGTTPNAESAWPNPLTRLGQCYRELEERCRRLKPGVLVIRTGVCFGADDESDFVARTLQQLAAGMIVAVSIDRTVSPCYLPELARNALDLLIDDELGIWHLANSGTVSWFEWAQAVATMADFAADRVTGCLGVHGELSGCRRHRSALASERGSLMAPWRRALGQYFAARRTALAA